MVFPPFSCLSHLSVVISPLCQSLTTVVKESETTFVVSRRRDGTRTDPSSLLLLRTDDSLLLGREMLPPPAASPLSERVRLSSSLWLFPSLLLSQKKGLLSS